MIKYKIHIASFLFAVVVWFLVVTDGTFDHIVSVPIRMPDSPPNMILAKSFPQQAKMRVRGQGMTLLAYLLFREAQLEPKVEWKIGPQTVHMTKEDVVLSGAAKSISVLQLIDPLERTIVIEKRMEKTVVIKTQITVKPMPGYTVVDELVFNPDSVTVAGPASVIRAIDAVYTKEKVLEKVKRPVAGEVELIVPPDQRIELSPAVTAFRQDVQKLMEKRISRIPIRVINVPEGVSAFAIPASLSLIAEGGVQRISTLTEKEINAYIDFPRAAERGGADYPAYVDPLPGVRFRSIEPKRFKVILERKNK